MQEEPQQDLTFVQRNVQMATQLILKHVMMVLIQPGTFKMEVTGVMKLVLLK